MVKKVIKEILSVIVPSIIVVFILLNYVLIPCKVIGSSMYPTLKEGDFGYSFICTRNININRFDICVINVGKKLLVKRVIGLPNDLVEYKDNVLYINGVVYDEYFLNENVYTENLSIQLNGDEYYCLGDNRNVSLDSRSYGPFPKEKLKSTHFFRVLPLESIEFK